MLNWRADRRLARVTTNDQLRTCDVAIVGGGIVGLATAYRLLQDRPGTDVLLLEKESTVGAHQTGHNSGVIHSGIYYKPGSRKAETCVRGAAAMKEFCREHGIPVDHCGKVVVATDESEIPRLDELERRGRANGVPDMRRLDPDGLREIEPHATGLSALHVPGTAAVDYVAVSRKLAELVQAAGGEVRTGAHVTGLERDGTGVRVDVDDGTHIEAGFAVTCGGLQSDRIARGTAPETRTRIVPFRGEYYVLEPDSRHLVRGMIYPVPDPRFPFLGVHFTRTVDGGVEAGPNAVLALHREGYGRFAFSLRDTVSTLTFPGFWRLASRHLSTGAGEVYRSFSKGAFTRALQKLLPGIRAEHLRRGGCGIRAQALDPQGKLVDDFVLAESDRVVHVLNAPSPAATASLAIGEQIAAHVSNAPAIRTSLAKR